MFNLIGYYTDHEYRHGGWTGKKTLVEIVVATFDDEKVAKQYIRKAWLRDSKDRERPFRKSSLLANFEMAEVVEKVAKTPLPHNPRSEDG